MARVNKAYNNMLCHMTTENETIENAVCYVWDLITMQISEQQETLKLGNNCGPSFSRLQCQQVVDQKFNSVLEKKKREMRAMIAEEMKSTEISYISSLEKLLKVQMRVNPFLLI